MSVTDLHILSPLIRLHPLGLLGVQLPGKGLILILRLCKNVYKYLNRDFGLGIPNLDYHSEY